VKPFLYRLFSDPDILVGIPTPLRQMLAFFIAQTKGPSSVKMYEKIGGGSPQLRWTRAQADRLAVELKSGAQAAQLGETRVGVGMRAWDPSIEKGLSELREWGATELVLLPLFPQFSTTTTGSCFKEVRRILSKWKWSPVVHEVRSWADDVGYIKLLRETVDESIAEATAHGPVHVLFSAHSLPMKIVERGDTYPTEVAATVNAVAHGLACPWSLSYQSRNGSMPWLAPYTEDELEKLGKAGVRQVVVVPVSFVSDHIETLYELDLLYADHARSHGIVNYYRSRVFNDCPKFARVLASFVAVNR
jgi:ferrochelatase